VGKFGNTRPVWGTYKSGGTCALGVGTIVDFGSFTFFTVPPGDVYFGASQGSGCEGL
jgi:hypothetical protein